MGNWFKKTLNKIDKGKGFFTFLRAQFSSNISSLTDNLTCLLFANIFGVYYGLAVFIGNFAGGIVNCFINYKWTFKARGLFIPHVLIKFIMVWLGSIFLNTYGTILFTEYVLHRIPTEHLPDLVVQNIFMVPKLIVSILVGWIWNYNMQRLFVYRDNFFTKFLNKIYPKSSADKEEVRESESSTNLE